MPRPQLLQLWLVLVLAVTSAASAQVPFLPDHLQDPPDTASYITLLRRLDGAKGMDRAYALGRMRRSYPDSARTWAIHNIRTMGGFSAAVAANAILGDSAEGIPTLMGILPSLPDSVLSGLGRPLGEALHFAGSRPDSLQWVLFRSGNGEMRALAMRIFTADLDITPVRAEERELLEQGTRDRDPAVRAAALGAIAWRVPSSDSAGRIWSLGYFRSALTDIDAEVRTEALHDIAWRGASLPNDVEKIRGSARRGHSPQERRAAVMALGVQGAAALPAVPDLLALLRDGDGRLGEDALMAVTELARAGVARTPQVRAAVAAYRARLENPYAQLGVVRALAALRDTTALVGLIQERDTIVAAGALRALVGVAPTHPAVAEALDDPRPNVAGVAVLGVVPILFRDSMAVHPRTRGGRAGRDSALAQARSLIASRLVGKCFAVSRGPYRPAMDIGLDSVYGNPPKTIAFLADPSGFPAYREYEARIALANGSPPSVGVGLWSWDLGADSLRAAWSTGFSGVGLSAGWEGDGLRGTIRPFWDFPRQQQEAEVHLTPVECRSIDPDRETRY